MEVWEKAINQILDKVFEDLSKYYLDKLVEFIDNLVYKPNPGSTYSRTNQFLNSFEKKNESNMKEIIQKIYFNSDNLTHEYQSDTGWWQHGVEGLSYTDMMAQILNDKSLNQRYSQGGGATHVNYNSEMYWDEFLKYINDNFKKDFIRTCKKYGMDVSMI